MSTDAPHARRVLESIERHLREQTMRDPRTPAEWQEAVDLAHGALCLDAARQYGLVTGGPAIDVSRCEQVLRRGQQRGVVPSPGAAERFALAFANPPPPT